MVDDFEGEHGDYRDYVDETLNTDLVVEINKLQNRCDNYERLIYSLSAINKILEDKVTKLQKNFTAGEIEDLMNGKES